MISKKMKRFEDNSSAVRAMFEEGVKLREKYGAENVYDFSLGNPNVPAPEEVKEAIIDLLDSEKELVLHGYMNNAGFPDVREAIAQSINKRFGTSFTGRNIVMTVGAASGLCVVFRMILDTDDEVSTTTISPTSMARPLRSIRIPRISSSIWKILRVRLQREPKRSFSIIRTTRPVLSTPRRPSRSSRRFWRRSRRNSEQ